MAQNPQDPENVPTASELYLLIDETIKVNPAATDATKTRGVTHRELLKAMVDYTTDEAVSSVAGKTGAVSLVKADVGLSNVDNTSDLSKPISTATQTALNGKAAIDNNLVNRSAGRFIINASGIERTYSNANDILISSVLSGEVASLQHGGTVYYGDSVVFITGAVFYGNGAKINPDTASKIIFNNCTFYNTKFAGLGITSGGVNDATFGLAGCTLVNCDIANCSIQTYNTSGTVVTNSNINLHNTSVATTGVYFKGTMVLNTFGTTTLPTSTTYLPATVTVYKFSTANTTTNYTDIIAKDVNIKATTNAINLNASQQFNAQVGTSLLQVNGTFNQTTKPTLYNDTLANFLTYLNGAGLTGNKALVNKEYLDYYFGQNTPSAFQIYSLEYDSVNNTLVTDTSAGQSESNPVIFKTVTLSDDDDNQHELKVNESGELVIDGEVIGSSSTGGGFTKPVLALFTTGYEEYDTFEEALNSGATSIHLNGNYISIDTGFTNSDGSAVTIFGNGATLAFNDGVTLSNISLTLHNVNINGNSNLDFSGSLIRMHNSTLDAINSNADGFYVYGGSFLNNVTGNSGSISSIYLFEDANEGSGNTNTTNIINNGLYNPLSALRTNVIAGTYVNGEYQGSLPEYSKLGQKFFDEDYLYELLPDIDNAGKWIRTAKV